MTVIIDTQIKSAFPNLKIGVIRVSDMDNARSSKEVLEVLRSAEKESQDTIDLETLATHPKIADWREAYRSFGLKPSKYKCSVEALLRRVLKMSPLPDINPLVNLYNAVSIKHIVPVGADDSDFIEGNVHLTYADGSERFVMLGSESEEHPETGEIIYRDDKDVLCRAWNYRECDKSKITNQTKNCILVIEGLEHTSRAELQAAINELKALVKTHLGGSFQVSFPHKI